MLKTLLTHEILNLLKSRRVYWTVLMFILLYASVFIVRVIDYQKQVNQYIADMALNEQELQDAPNYSHMNPRAIQQPIVFSIYNEGFKKPRVVDIYFFEPIAETTSLNEENNPLSIDDTSLDITFLITFFLSLFILLISYDCVNGEKQTGTLRILMTYPLKRQSFILKKVLGVFIFVAFTFTIPYVLSLISLVFIYANLLNVNFFLSAFFYWFLVLLFIFFFSLLGIFISTCTTRPNRSLVYSLLVWIMLAIILPISWDYIIQPSLYNNKLVQLNQNYIDKTSELIRLTIEVPDEANRWQGSYRYWNGVFYGGQVLAFGETLQYQLNYQRYMYDTYYPVARETEQAIDQAFRKRISVESVKTMAFFFNPIVQFNNLASKITGNAREDHLKFLHDAREVRDELVNLGAKDDWLFDYRFLARYTAEYTLPPIMDLYMQFDEDISRVYEYAEELEERAVFYKMEMPVFRRYAHPVFTFGEVFGRIFVTLCIFVVCILALWLMTWYKFMKYDVR